jgi:uncharacterized protein YndB with AHSA1/START domain
MSAPAALRAPAGDRVKVSVRVEVEPAEAFEVFTTRIDLWWKRGPRFRQGGGEEGLIAIEPRVGGRVFETITPAGGTAHVIEIGRVRAWQPPEHLAFSWRNANFAAGEATDVDVTFASVAGGTMVTLTHSGWSTLRPDHPARHGQDVAAFTRMMGLWWGEQLGSLRRRAEGAQ